MIKRINFQIKGRVQGVGFRPFIYRLAQEKNFSGFVTNSGSDLLFEWQGDGKTIDTAFKKIAEYPPLGAKMEKIDRKEVELDKNNHSFSILSSQGLPNYSNLPDISTCQECYSELFDPADRRYLYPFINCSQCGPRHSIIESLPYDRKKTTMRQFKMCLSCEMEFKNPDDRRFHAQPIACPDCGPQLSEDINQIVMWLRKGKIVGLKSVGGFHLICDSLNKKSVQLLRNRKLRPNKPFALLMRDSKQVRQYSKLNALEEKHLLSSESPIVLLRSHNPIDLVAPGLNSLGIMVPSNPIHKVLMTLFKNPLIATSGNLSSEPMAFSNKDALARLSSIADVIVTHNRSILRPLEDSIVRVVGDRTIILRSARGYSPVGFPLKIQSKGVQRNILGVGAHYNSSIARIKNNRIELSQHLGDLDTEKNAESYRKAIYDFSEKKADIAHDTHADYLSTIIAEETGSRLFPIQHHRAHVFSVLAEEERWSNGLGIAFDGTGLGDDGSIWGSEFFLIPSMKRVCSLLPFPLPGNSTPSKMAQVLRFMAFGKCEDKKIEAAIEKNLFLSSSSMGRFFDGISSLMGICHQNSYQGEAPTKLEAVALSENAIGEIRNPYPFSLLWQNILQIDWRPTVKAFLLEPSSSRFHLTIATMIIEVAEYFCEKNIILSGGCFQNSVLLRQVIRECHKKGITAITPKKIPINDAGISVGQAFGALGEYT